MTDRTRPEPRHMLGFDANRRKLPMCKAERATYRPRKKPAQVTCIPCLEAANSYALEHGGDPDVARQVKERLEELQAVELEAGDQVAELEGSEELEVDSEHRS